MKFCDVPMFKEFKVPDKKCFYLADDMTKHYFDKCLRISEKYFLVLSFDYFCSYCEIPFLNSEFIDPNLEVESITKCSKCKWFNKKLSGVNYL